MDPTSAQSTKTTIIFKEKLLLSQKLNLQETKTKKVMIQIENRVS